MLARATLARMKRVDFLAVGDTVVDDFIRIKDAAAHCRLDNEGCELCVRFGDKVPFESSTVIYGVGNAANAAVSAARLGLSSGLLTHVGKDDNGERIIKRLKKEGISADGIKKQSNMPTNYHYVLWYESERTILVKHQAYAYEFPKNTPPAKALYLSSLAEEAGDAYYESIAEYLEKNPSTLFAFQPGTFQMKLGVARLKRLYARTDLFFCNKEEAARILTLPPSTPIKELLSGMRALGPKTVVITDGPAGAYADDGTNALFVPMYPDTSAPFERTGAGDAFASTVASALVLGNSLEEALLWGPINSMSVVQKVGAQEGLLARSELQKLLTQAPESYKTTAL